MRKLIPLFSLLLTTTAAQAQSPCPFDPYDYLAYNPDVQAAVFSGTYASAYEHYALAGISENRAYNRSCGPLPRNPYCPFVEHEYLAYNPDIRAAVHSGIFSSGRAHFAQSGHAENRVLSRECADNRGLRGDEPCAFNEFDYLAFNPDVQAAVFRGEFAGGYDHYVKTGLAEGRAYNLFCGPTPRNRYCPFDEQDYLAYNHDVMAAVHRGVFASGRAHFMSAGHAENRILSRECANPDARRRRDGGGRGRDDRGRDGRGGEVKRF